MNVMNVGEHSPTNNSSEYTRELTKGRNPMTVKIVIKLTLGSQALDYIRKLTQGRHLMNVLNLGKLPSGRQLS